MRLSFYPVDVTYVVRDGRAAILLYGRDVSGRQVCVVDDSFEPYFTVVGNIDPVLLEALRDGDFFVTRVEKVNKNLNEHDVDALRVFTNLPKGVPVLKDLAKSIPGVAVYEYDVLFARRYLIDKRIIPMVRTEVEGEEVQLGFRVPCLRVSKIWQEADDILAPRVLAVDIETYNPDNKVNMKKNPILMIGLYGANFSRVVTWKKFSSKLDYVEFVGSEADMLKRFVELVHECGPDVITGYFSDGFDFPYLAERAKVCKVQLDIGLDGSKIDIAGKIENEARIAGISHVDIFKFVRRVMSRSLKTDVFTLDAVSKELLGAQKHKVDMNRLAPAWDECSQDLEEFCKYNLQDCKLTYDLAVKVLPLLLEFVRIIRLPPYDINRMPFSTFVEWYLIHQAAGRNEIILNRPSRDMEGGRMADRVKGAFVFEPKPGFYEKIAVFDYRSLYPSIIASHNISKGVLNCNCCTDGPTIDTERGKFRYCAKRKGLFSEVIQELILRRAEIKKEIKKSQDPLLAARSEALKVLANSFYGYMGFAPARWYCIECAESTTAWARHYIHKAIETAQQAGFTVLYSDTDSVFLLLDKKSKDEALALVEQVNKSLPGLMELDFEGFYPSGVFVSLKAGEAGAKKKYALLDEKGNMKIKGFESVRRNWSFIAKDVQKRVLEIILKDHDAKKAKAYVRQVVDDLRKNKIPLDKVVIHTALSKGTGAYSSIGPHVAAARRLESQGVEVGSGTIVKYVVIKGKGKIRDKVRLPHEAKQDDYDGEYYIQNQVVPGVERIFAVLDIKVDDLISETKQSSLSGF
ncbi:ribonuclease H-like domain-containing protein [Candidatus Woesearchaeota archaeon]|nr:ribonuclease H-like domain-containing protein [Candidatus Woesearchaeota archaeon]